MNNKGKVKEMRQKTQAEPEKSQTLREAMFEALRCCEIWGVVVIVKQDDTTITLDSPAFVDILSDGDREIIKGYKETYDQEIPILTAEECQNSYNNFFTLNLMATANRKLMIMRRKKMRKKMRKKAAIR